MKKSVSARARQLATELQRLFAHDAELAHKLSDSHRRLLDANKRVWSGLHPDGLRALLGDHPASEAARLEATDRGRAQVLESTDVLGALQEAYWQIHRARCDHQQVAEDRRRLAGDIGEIVRTFVDELLAVDWSEQDPPSRAATSIDMSIEACTGTTERSARPSTRFPTWSAMRWTSC